MIHCDCIDEDVMIDEKKRFVIHCDCSDEDVVIDEKNQVYDIL